MSAAKTKTLQLVWAVPARPWSIGREGSSVKAGAGLNYIYTRLRYRKFASLFHVRISIDNALHKSARTAQTCRGLRCFHPWKMEHGGDAFASALQALHAMDKRDKKEEICLRRDPTRSTYAPRGTPTNDKSVPRAEGRVALVERRAERAARARVQGCVGSQHQSFNRARRRSHPRRSGVLNYIRRAA